MTTLNELDDFRQFCKQASNNQLFHIYWKERDAGRAEYAREARIVAEDRGVELTR